MATTRLIPMHASTKHPPPQTIHDRIAYAVNPAKTDHGQWVIGYGCDPATAAAEMLLTKREYELQNGPERAISSNILLYQIRQAFAPGEITPEKAQQIGYELALRFTKGKHQFIVATHVDKQHIHTHIIFNSTAMDGARKFRNFLGSSFALRRISDRLCLEHGVSIIEHPGKAHKHYGKWLGDEKPLSQRDQLRNDIDDALTKKPSTFEAFISDMRAAGYEIKQGKYQAFRKAGQQRFIRLRSLGATYSEDSLRIIIAGEKPLNAQSKHARAPAPEVQERVSLLVDIQSKLLAGKGVGYERWAKKFNLKQMAQTLNYLTEHQLLNYEKLSTSAREASAQFSKLSSEIQSAEARIRELTNLREHIFDYRKTRDVYIAYRQSGYSKQFYAEHEAEILLHKTAKTAFDALPDRKIPSLKELNAEFETLLAAKKRAYGEYQQARREMQDVLTAKANVDAILGIDRTKSTVEPEHTR
ncbi:MAG TPA: relaxase/mobilization nuclease domain-containing protein [Clostridia bacterium]|nr:relaxase/mobilization nuclease domain-containing protein [Clostridia bacterium]